MSVVVNEIRTGVYLDSVALMRVSREIAAREGVEEAGLMIGTPANRAILRDAGVLNEVGETAGAGDLVIAVRAQTAAAAEAAMAEARRLIDRGRASPSGGAEGAAWRPRTTRAALQALPEANLALISVPGDFAAAEARKALDRGLDVMIFSDNVPLADEVALKQRARAAGRIVMGPDCGTAIIGGVPLAFANAVPRGDIGVIGASGTGIQEVTCLVARLGGGILHAIGTGGRDLSAEVGAITTLTALDMLEADAATRTIVLISKPPAAHIARAVLDRVAQISKPCVVCFLGSGELAMPANARLARTLEDAAYLATGRTAPRADAGPTAGPARGPLICGLFSGGTLSAEAQLVLADAGLTLRSNAPVPGVAAIAGDDLGAGHTLLDLGDDEFTRGRPHPMIEPATRDAFVARACGEARIGVLLVDVVLGYGAHADPGGHLADQLAGLASRPIVIASVTGTDADPQGYAAQVAKLAAAGVHVAASNAQAARWALAAVAGLPR
ncbi:MAG: acyl-CoA synthetase FdrA [Hyphomicrobiaceae bacterium]